MPEEEIEVVVTHSFGAMVWREVSQFETQTVSHTSAGTTRVPTKDKTHYSELILKPRAEP